MAGSKYESLDPRQGRAFGCINFVSNSANLNIKKYIKDSRRQWGALNKTFKFDFVESCNLVIVLQ